MPGPYAAERTERVLMGTLPGAVKTAPYRAPMTGKL